ncbi:unnamed protein product [Hymenolepis diminuta]|uniref:WAP domain-containing protein n=1 Tax=Hymenolepis diminuta TaxID=6216 RepID=A0A0R3SXH1_HYMDI|nr:unnamed protein product [Hymenolepis diminuta]VUZ56655.1 unnamed protein product [Hymenolepis diminuta]
MKLFVLCLFVAIATAARPYRYAREEYRPARRYSERYIRELSPVYPRSLPRFIRSLEEEEEQTYQVPAEIKRPEEVVERRFGQVRNSRSLPKEEEIASYEQTPEVEEEGQIEQTPVEQESEEDNELYEDSSFFDDAEDEDEYEELTHEDEEEEDAEEDEDEEDYPYEKTYEFQSGYEPYQDKSYEHVDKHENNLEHEEEEEEEAVEHHEKEVAKENHSMPIELADIVFSFPDCSSITCSKAGLEGYGCKDSRCKFICSKEECYEYPDGPTDYEELQAIEEMHEEEEEETTTAEITTTTEATTTTITTTPEPETTTQAPKKRRSAMEKRGKSRKDRSRQ